MLLHGVPAVWLAWLVRSVPRTWYGGRSSSGSFCWAGSLISVPYDEKWCPAWCLEQPARLQGVASRRYGWVGIARMEIGVGKARQLGRLRVLIVADLRTRTTKNYALLVPVAAGLEGAPGCSCMAGLILRLRYEYEYEYGVRSVVLSSGQDSRSPCDTTTSYALPVSGAQQQGVPSRLYGLLGLRAMVIFSSTEIGV